MKEQEVIKRLNFHKEYVRLYSSRVVMISETDLETVLNMLKEKDKEIEKKDRQINLMAEIFYKKFKAELLLEYGFEGEEQLKQYFKEIAERKSENETN